MSAYCDEFSEISELGPRKELFGTMINVEGDIAMDVISNLNEIGISDSKKEAKNTIKQVSTDILSRVDEMKTIKPEVEDKRQDGQERAKTDKKPI